MQVYKNLNFKTLEGEKQEWLSLFWVPLSYDMKVRNSWSPSQAKKQRSREGDYGKNE